MSFAATTQRVREVSPRSAVIAWITTTSGFAAAVRGKVRGATLTK